MTPRQLDSWKQVFILCTPPSVANMAATVDVNDLTEIADIKEAYAVIQQQEVTCLWYFYWDIITKLRYLIYRLKIVYIINLIMK